MPQIAGIAYRHKAPDAESTAQIASAERQADLGWDRMEDLGLVSKLGPAAQTMRNEKGINLIEIAYHFGRSESALSKFENGHTKPHELDRLVEVYATVLGVTSADIWRRAWELWAPNGGS